MTNFLSEFPFSIRNFSSNFTHRYAPSLSRNNILCFPLSTHNFSTFPSSFLFSLFRSRHQNNDDGRKERKKLDGTEKKKERRRMENFIDFLNVIFSIARHFKGFHTYTHTHVQLREMRPRAFLMLTWKLCENPRKKMRRKSIFSWKTSRKIDKNNVSSFRKDSNDFTIGE